MPSRKRDDESEEERFESADDEEDVKPKAKRQSTSKGKSAKPASTSADAVALEENDQGEQYLKLSESRRLTVRTFKERVLVDIREFYKDKSTGELKPGSKGISLTKEQWEILKGAIGDVDEAIAAIEPKKK